MEDKVKVLVVDDDKRMVRTICDILKIKGFPVLAAYSGEEAVEQVKAMAPDCVLMDIKMPGIDGVEAFRMIKELAPDLPVLLMTAYASEEKILEAKRLGAYAILGKPIDFQSLLSFLSLLKREEFILVVDDDPQFCSTLKDILQMRNYQVETAAAAEQAFGHLNQQYALAVILDLKLGDTDGLALLQQIRQYYPSKPVVLVTGYREEMASSIERGMQIGAHCCFYKPFEVDDLLGILKEIRENKLRVMLTGNSKHREDTPWTAPAF